MPFTIAAQEAASNELGRQLAIRGADNGVASCASCHGALGEGSGAAGFPRIAGQPHYYLVHQMESFANGSRNNPIMTPIAKKLTKQQIGAVAEYYAALAAPSTTPAVQADAKTMERGQILATIGDNNRRVQACTNCHGPAGSGEPPAFPYLAGQHSAYLMSALRDWQSGARNTDPSGQMPVIASLLNDDDRAAVIAYFSSLAAPLPAAQRVNIPAGSTMRPVKPGVPSLATPRASEGVGVEQRTPTTGGVQGPGGSTATGDEPAGGRSGAGD
jgi:cytochrome c553